MHDNDISASGAAIGSPLVVLNGSDAVTSSLTIAAGTEVEHRAVLQLIRSNMADFEQFGLVAFEMRARPAGQHGGGDVSVALLSEPQATLLLTFMRNTEVVKRFKVALVRAFFELRERVASTRALPMTEDEIVLHALTIQNRKIAALSAKVAEDRPKVEAWDELMESDGTYSLLAASKILGWGRNTMMRDLRRMGILQGNNLPYQRYEHHFKVIPGTYVNRKTGQTVPTATAYVRPSGVAFLRKKLNQAPAVVVVPAEVDA